MSEPSYKKGGFIDNKYIVVKTDDSPMDPDAQYFVLRLDKDPHARVALRAYAESVKADNEELAQDLFNLLYVLATSV